MTPEQVEAARERDTARLEFIAMEQALYARRREVLDADEEYQRLLRRARALEHAAGMAKLEYQSRYANKLENRIAAVRALDRNRNLETERNSQ